MCWKVLLERLRNETTRLTAVKAWGTLAGSPLVPSLGAALEPLVAELTSFLRKANRRLRQTALTTTEVVLPAGGPVRKHCQSCAAAALHDTEHCDAEAPLTEPAMHVAAAMSAVECSRSHSQTWFPTCRWWWPGMAVRSTLRRWRPQCTRWRC